MTPVARRRWILLAPMSSVALLLGCVGAVGAKTPVSVRSAESAAARDDRPATAPWRPELLEHCPDAEPASPAVDECLAMAAELFADRSGSDAVMELELCLEENSPDVSLLLTLAQLYVFAAQGQDTVRPAEGPAAGTGDPDRDRERWSDRAEELLRLADEAAPEDAVVDYLRAEIHRVRRDDESAATTELQAMRKCSYPSSLEIVRHYQRLQTWPARITTPVRPDYPAEAQRRRLQSDVTLDLLINPEGRVERVDVIEGPDIFVAAAVNAAREAGYQAARVGNYPVWAQLRLEVPFRLADER